MTFDLDVRQYAAGTIGLFSEGDRSIPACFDHLTSVATQENFSYKLGSGINLKLGVGKVPRRVEGFGQRKVLFGNNPTRDSLAAKISLT